jgi:hypothetical protein
MRRAFVALAIVCMLAAEWGLTSGIESGGTPGSTLNTVLRLAVGVVALLGVIAVAVAQPPRARPAHKPEQSETQAEKER